MSAELELLFKYIKKVISLLSYKNSYSLKYVPLGALQNFRPTETFSCHTQERGHIMKTYRSKDEACSTFDILSNVFQRHLTFYSLIQLIF